MLLSERKWLKTRMNIALEYLQLLNSVLIRVRAIHAKLAAASRQPVFIIGQHLDLGYAFYACAHAGQGKQGDWERQGGQQISILMGAKNSVLVCKSMRRIR